MNKKKFNLIVSLKKFQFTNNFFFVFCYINTTDDKIYLSGDISCFSLFFGLFRMTVVFSQERRVYLSACASSAFFMIFLRKRITFSWILCRKQSLVDRTETFHSSLFNKMLKNQLHCEHFFFGCVLVSVFFFYFVWYISCLVINLDENRKCVQTKACSLLPKNFFHANAQVHIEKWVTVRCSAYVQNAHCEYHKMDVENYSSLSLWLSKIFYFGSRQSF